MARTFYVGAPSGSSKVSQHWIAKQDFETSEAPPSEWREEEYRRAFMEESVEQGIAWQIRINRQDRGWTQADLASRIGTKQSAVSRLEDPLSGPKRIDTLVSVAHAFDCALIVRLAPYSDLWALSGDLTQERLHVPSFIDESPESLLEYMDGN